MDLCHTLLLPPTIPQDHPGSHNTVPHHQPRHAGPTSRCTHHWTTNAPGSHQPSPTNSSHQLINQQLPISTSTTCTTWTAPVCTIYDTNSTCQRHQLLSHRSTVPNPKHQPSFDPHHSTAQFDRQCQPPPPPGPPKTAQPPCPTITSHHHHPTHLNSSNCQQPHHQQPTLSTIAIHFPMPSAIRKSGPRHQLSPLHWPTEHGPKYQLSPTQHTSYRSLVI